MAKASVKDFDPDVCRGDHPDVDGECPHLTATGEDTGHGFVDRLSRVEGQAIQAVTGDDPGSCGCCGCPLPNLEVFNQAPKECPRLALHDSM